MHIVCKFIHVLVVWHVLSSVSLSLLIVDASLFRTWLLQNTKVMKRMLRNCKKKFHSLY